jgi:glycosyltransferase involved in cell wall biosynthesis
VQVRTPLRRDGVAVEEVPAPDEHAPKLLPVRVLLADPPAFTPWYDHELARALGAAGADVELATSRFRFGELPDPDGYRRSERFYPLSSRLFKRSRLRLPLKAAEHLAVLASLARAKPDVVHLQWLALPQADVRLRFRAPSVFTAHDLLPRRTASHRDLWQRLLARFDRVVVHTERGRATLAELGVDARVIAHPVYPSAALRADDGHTLLALGVIRPYKGLPDAIEATRRLPDVRLIVAGDPAMPLDELRGAERVDWRLGYLPQSELDRALSETTVAVFPYRAELDQSGALLQALGAGVPAVVYDVAGLGEPIRRFGAGRVVQAGDVEALSRAVGELLGDPDALAAARAGADAARRELTWSAAAAQHLALYEELQ